MPTYGYIHETREDRLHERGEHEPPPRVVQCSVCGEVVADQPALAIHLGNAHPLSAPRLLIDGEVVVGERLVYRPLDGSRVAVVNASELLVSESGGPATPWSSSALREAVFEAEQAVLDITLRNERAGDGAVATEEVRLRIDVPAATELDYVDDLFGEHLAVNGLDQHDVDGFAEATGQFERAARYASALHEYGVAVLIKDEARGTSEALDAESAGEKLQRALEVLRYFPERPTARTVVGFARFNVNDFRSAPLPTGVAALDQCAEQLRRLAGQPETPEVAASSDGPVRRCPTDSGTAGILESWADAAQRPADSLRELLALSRDPATLLPDAVKCRALALRLALDDRNSEDPVAELAGTLSNDVVFGAWAGEIIEDARRHG